MESLEGLYIPSILRTRFYTVTLLVAFDCCKYAVMILDK
jgi:hypothetical protein